MNDEQNAAAAAGKRGTEPGGAAENETAHTAYAANMAIAANSAAADEVAPTSDETTVEADDDADPEDDDPEDAAYAQTGCEASASAASAAAREIRFQVPNDSGGERLDTLAAACCGLTRSAAARLIADGLVTVSGKPAAKSARPAAGDTVCVTLPPPRQSAAVPQNIPLDIVYEDDALLVVNKPRGMVVHPAPGNPDGTLVNALLYHCGGSLSGIGGVIRPGIVHRIDKDTSGLLMVAKTDAAHRSLAAQIKAHSFTRLYHAVVLGSIRDDAGTVACPIGRHPKDRKKMAVTERNGKPAVTHYRVLARFDGYTYLELRLETGRTHQIRVHMAHLGHAVLGDPLYAPNGGKNRFGLVGQCLHAAVIGFRHPISGKELLFSAEDPPYFTRILDKLR